MHVDAPSRRVSGPAEPALIDRVLDAVDDLWTAVPHVPEQDRTLFAVALSEIVTNIVQHGARDRPVRVDAVITAGSEELTATVVDDGPPVRLDRQGTDMPGAEEESGRGLALVRTVLDGFEHRRDSRGNVWVLRRRLPADR